MALGDCVLCGCCQLLILMLDTSAGRGALNKHWWYCEKPDKSVLLRFCCIDTGIKVKAKQEKEISLEFLNSLFAARLAGALWKLGCAAESHEMKYCGFRIMLLKVFKQMKLLR